MDRGSQEIPKTSMKLVDSSRGLVQSWGSRFTLTCGSNGSCCLSNLCHVFEGPPVFFQHELEVWILCVGTQDDVSFLFYCLARLGCRGKWCLVQDVTAAPPIKGTRHNLWAYMAANKELALLYRDAQTRKADHVEQKPKLHSLND